MAASRRDVGARQAHGDADVGLLEGRRVVHAVAGHRDDLLHLLEGRHDLHLVLGGDPREDHVLRLAELGLEVVIGHVLQVGAGDHPHRAVAAHDADAAGDGFGRQAVVAGHHDDADAGGEGVLDGLADLGPRRVDHADQAEEGELGLDRVGRVVGQGDRQVALGDGQHAQRLARHVVVAARGSARAARRSWARPCRRAWTSVQRGMVSDGAPLT